MIWNPWISSAAIAMNFVIFVYVERKCIEAGDAGGVLHSAAQFALVVVLFVLPINGAWLALLATLVGMAVARVVSIEIDMRRLRRRVRDLNAWAAALESCRDRP